jgi:hypothetical protein
MKCIAYKSGYKYQLKETYTLPIPLVPPLGIDTEYISLDTTGVLTIKDGYAWDGPSGPSIDTLSFMRGSLVHDALYQLMREGHLDHTVYREAADRALRDICREDGMCPIRAWWVYQGVRIFGNFAADPADKRPIIRAPKGCEG